MKKLKLKKMFLRGAKLSLFASIMTSCSVISDGVDSTLTAVVKKRNTNKTKGEVTAIEIENNNPNSGMKISGVPTLVAGFIADEVESGVSSAAGRYSATTEYRKVGEEISGLSKITLIRKVNIRGKEVEASKLVFDVTKHKYKESMLYTATLVSANITYPKTAIPRWDNDLDLVVNLQINAFGGKKMDEVVNSEFVIPKVVLGTSWENRDTTNAKFNSYRTSWFALPSGKGSAYVITAKVQETSNFYKTAEKGKTLAGEKKEKLSTTLAKLFGADEEE